MPFPYYTSFDAGVPGSNVAPSPASVFTSLDGVLSYTADSVLGSAAIRATVGATAAGALGQIAHEVVSTAYYRWYVKLGAKGTLFYMAQLVNATTNANGAGLSVDTVGGVRIRNGTTGVNTASTTQLSTTEWTRVEWMVSPTIQRVRLYQGANLHGNTPTYDSGDVTWTSPGTWDRTRLGSTLIVANVDVLIDEFAASTTGWMGSAFIAPSNPPVLADIPNQTVAPNDQVTIYAVVISGDTPTSYVWRQVSGPAVTLSGTANSITFTVPSSASSSTIVIGVVAVAGESSSAEKTASISVSSVVTAPTIAPLSAQVAMSFQQVTLTAVQQSGSTITDWVWDQISGPAVTLSGTGQTQTFIAPALRTASTLVFRVTGTAGSSSAQQTVTITVRAHSKHLRTASGWKPVQPRKITLQETVEPVVMQTFNYTSTNDQIANPGRGPYTYTETHWTDAAGAGKVPLNSTDLANKRTGTETILGYSVAARTVVFRYYIIEHMRNNDDIPQAFLDMLSADFAACRAAGVKMVPRFSYSNDGSTGGNFDGNGPYAADTTPTRTFGHLAQLAPVMKANTDVIHAVQAGFVGVWGEHYYTDYWGNKGTLSTADWNNRARLFTEILSWGVTLLVRYVGMKARYIREGSGTGWAAPTGAVGRIGFHNDAFNATSNPDLSDWGTFNTFADGMTVDQARAYLVTETARPVPMMGESAGVSDRTAFTPLRDTLVAQRWSALNFNYHPDVWGAMSTAQKDEISRNLGYRLSLSSAVLPTSGSGSSTTQVTLTFQNNGYAPPYTARPIRLVFTGPAGTVTRTLAADIRTLKPGQTVITETVTLPVDPGTYSIHLSMPDPVLTDAAYAIRLANTTAWANGMNNLNTSVQVGAAGPIVPTTPPVTVGTQFYRAPQQVDSYVAQYPELSVIADQPQGVWLTDASNITTRINNLKNASAGKTLLLVVYNIPGRDGNNFSGGGFATAAEYRTWIDQLAAAVGTASAWYCVEPDALGLIDGLTAAQATERKDLIKYAAEKLGANANARVYIDASMWMGAQTMASLLTEVTPASGIEGFTINVSNYNSNSSCITYGNSVLAFKPSLKYVIDTSRNGKATANGEWCNPPGQGLGIKPTTATENPNVDAYLWIKAPGESDGTCNGGPSAGAFWVARAQELIANAVFGSGSSTTANATANFSNVRAGSELSGAMSYGSCISTYSSGVNIIKGFTAERDAYRKLLQDLGPMAYRIPLAWNGGQPGSSAGGARSFGDAGQYVAAIKGVGGIPIIAVGGTNNDNDILASDAAALVRYFNDNGGQNGGPVTNWIIGNEPDNGFGVGNYINGGAGSSGFNAIAAAMRAASAQPLKLSGPSFVTWADYKIPEYNQFLDTCGAQVDVLDFHAYDGDNLGLYSAAMTWIETAIESRASTRNRVKVHLGEFNYHSSYVEPTWGANQFWTSVNTVAVAATLGRIIEQGGRAYQYSDNNGPLGMITPGDNFNGAPDGLRIPTPAYFGVKMWTGGNLFRAPTGSMATCSTTHPDTEMYASTENKNVVFINKSTNTSRNVVVALTGASSSDVYEVWQTQKGTNPNDVSGNQWKQPVKVASGTYQDGKVAFVAPSLTVTTIVVGHTISGSGSFGTQPFGISSFGG